MNDTPSRRAEHPRGAAPASPAEEPTSFLYPFIESEERDAGALLDDLARSARAKMATSRGLRAATIEASAPTVAAAATAMAERFARGGRLFAFGNGGSATDADGLVELFRRPPWGRALPAMTLADRAVLTALANDIGFDVVFSRQLIAQAAAADVAVGFSTSGDSVNVLRGLDEAARRGLLTVGLCGYEGGAMAAAGTVAHCLRVPSDSVHRIQETQDALVWELWSAVQARLAEEPGGVGARRREQGGDG